MQTTKIEKKVGVGFTILSFIFLLAMLGVYGPLSRYYKEPASAAVAGIPLVIMHLLFTLVGFGALLTVSDKSRWTGMGIALLVVSLNFILAPFLQRFWFQVFFGFRSDNGVNIDTTMVASFWDRQITQSRVTPSFESVRLSNLTSISFLVAMVACIGRVRIQSVLPAAVVFSVLFYLNLYLNALFAHSTLHKEENFIYLDDYGTILVYLFGGVAGLIAGVITKSPKENYIAHDRTSFMFSVIGSVFLLGSFICSFTGIIEGKNFYRLNSGALLMAFGTIAGVIGCFFGSVIVGRGYLHPRVMSIGLISGGIMTGVLAGEYNNIGIASILGFLGGLISGIFNTVVVPKINKRNVIDSQGLLGSIVIVSILGAIAAAPAMLNNLYKRRRNVWVVNKGSPETDWTVARYQLIYPAITIVIAAVTGVLIGIFLKAGNRNQTNYHDTKFWADSYGLNDSEEKQRQPEYTESRIKRSRLQSNLNVQTNL